MTGAALTEMISALACALQDAVAAAAQRCAVENRYDTARADALQALLYEIAVAHAELRATQALAEGLSAMSALDRGLALTFTSEVAAATLARLENIYGDLGLPLEPLFALRASPAMAALRTDSSRTEILGTRIAAGESYGEVALAEDTTLAAETFRRLAAEVVAPEAERIHRETRIVPESILQPMRVMGVFGLTIPARYGGSAGDREDTPLMLAVTETLSAASLAAAGSLITRPEILTRALLAGGTEGQKEFWLPRIAAGDPLGAIAITEPDYGSDVAALMLRATKTEGGWLLDGAKTWCTFAGKAGVLMVVARTDPDRGKGHRGLSVLLVEKPSYDTKDFRFEQAGGGGVLTGRAIATPGYRGMHSFDLAFENIFVPDSHVIGEEAGLGRGFYLTMAGLTGGRIQTAGRALGVMRAALDAAIAYASARKVFGKPLAGYQLTAVKLARMAARYAAVRHLAYAVAGDLDAGGDPMGASLAKLIACRAAEYVTREAMQIHGGMGYAQESAVSRYWLDARVLSIFEGAEETLALRVIARRLLEDAL